MKNVVVLGAGMVGSAIAIDMAKTHKVTLLDLNENALEKAKSKCNELTCLSLDVTDKVLLKSTLKPFELVICAVPGYLGYNTLKSIIEAGKDVVDISFFPENALELDNLAKEKDVTAIVDCGVAPGMDNIVLGHYNEKMKLTDFECLVGGLPKIKKWPFYYKAPFSPIDVIEEYTRPARYVENFKLITKEALTDCEYLNFKNIGTLESFNTDGLRSIIHTMAHIPNMKEKTLRFPGHIEFIKGLQESGFFSNDKLDERSKLSVLDFTSKVLFKEWKLNEEDEEFTIMRITLKGENQDGKTEEVIYELYDEYCQETKTSSMSRTTGYTATAAANLFLDGLFNEKGVFPPELVGKHEACFNFILKYLEERNVIYRKSSRLI
ncbi:MAG: saccharopine dehydrogenase [Flavobacteriaceae bacterium]|nr:saccharopine dehydrogenase NADP-binding domain-containing protein [Bacteroidia bacterium]NNL15821.1 saccharopine dehydrogenase [Flavobacteriaceae bacterium]